jgi:hypothetical protein
LEKKENVWIPVCCSRVMRCNMYRQPDGGVYGALLCSVCGKNVILEQEALAEPNAYGEGASVLNVLASPKPPKTERRKRAENMLSDDPTL